MYMTNRSQMGSIVFLIGTKQAEVFALELRKIAALVSVYTLASTNINQSAPNLVKMYMTLRSELIWIMGQIRPDRSGLSILELEKLLYLTLFILKHLQIYKPISTKLDQNVYDHKVLYVFDHGSYWTQTT